MQKHILWRMAAFALILALLVVGLDRALFDESTVQPCWQAIRSGSTEKVDVLFAGNSHTYASLDTDVLAQALHKNIQLLRCSSANGGIVAAMLEAYLHYTVPDIVVLECNPFMVDNYAAMRGDLKGIVYQSFDGIPGYWHKAKALGSVLRAEDVPAGVFQLFRPTAMWTRWQRGEKAPAPGYEPYQHVTFQRDYDAAAFEAYYRAEEAAEGSLHPANQQALDRIIALAEALDFDVWLIAAPVAHYAEGYQQDLRNLYAISQRCSRITLFDNSLQQLSRIGLTAHDFADAGHLSRRGAQKYTQHVMNLLADHYGSEPDVQGVLAYKGESAESGVVRMECWGDALYSFEYQGVQTPFSKENAFALPESAKPQDVTVRMRLQSDPEGAEAIYRFMEEREP